MQLLIIGHTIPEPSTTAAGGRMLQLIDLFIEQGYTVRFATSALQGPHSADLAVLGVIVDEIKLNDPSFDTYIKTLMPDVVMFDRFVMEEHYGWRVAEQCPAAVRILDTEDLHLLRKAREESIKKHGDLSMTDVFSETAKRELASIMRCDISLIISEFELALLTTTFGLPKSLLAYLPFMVEDFEMEDDGNFDDRNGFMTIGNYHHAPNVDSVLYLHKVIWPRIRTTLPSATLSVYGNYAGQQITQLHNEKMGFLIKGWAPSVEEAMQSARVCLAPLRYGAGLKGKILDALTYGTPVVTTPIGAEGMYGSLKSQMIVHSDEDQIASAAVDLHQNTQKWNQVRNIGFEIVRKRFNKVKVQSSFIAQLERLQSRLVHHRKQNFLGQVFQHHTLQTTRYMSRWIEEKGRNKQ